MRRRPNAGDEELRDLEREAKGGDRLALERLTRELLRRGVDPTDTFNRLEDAGVDIHEDLVRQAFVAGYSRVLNHNAYADSLTGDITNEAEDAALEAANERAVTGMSFHEDDGRWTISTAGDAVAVNGDLVFDGSGSPVVFRRDGHKNVVDLEAANARVWPPQDYVQNSLEGGDYPGGIEEELQLEDVAFRVLDRLGVDSFGYKTEPHPVFVAVYDLLVNHFNPRRYTAQNRNPFDHLIYWSSDDIGTEVYERVEDESETCAGCGEELDPGDGGPSDDYCTDCRSDRGQEHCRECDAEIEPGATLCESCEADERAEDAQS